MRKSSSSRWLFHGFFRVLVLIFAALAAGMSCASGDRFFDSGLGDFKAELAAAQKAGKRGVLLMFEADACPYCRRMRDQVLSRSDVQAYFHQHFAIYPVDVLGDVQITDFNGAEVSEKMFARSMRVRGTPTFVFVGLDGKELTRYSGATKDAKEFMQLGRYVAEGHYANQGFEQFYPEAKAERKKP